MPSLSLPLQLLRALPSSAVPISFSSSVNYLSWVSPSQGAGVDYNSPDGGRRESRTNRAVAIAEIATANEVIGDHPDYRVADTAILCAAVERHAR